MAGLTVATDTDVTDPVEIIYEAPDYFLIVPSASLSEKKVKAVRLNRDWIDGALYVGEE